ncbi:MAG: DUF2057 domain-containing protein [Gammaproteobacteria bacterium]|nr:MAG: DUF2057 domain-containing protein [Gammaproteobacteria bacterium]
MSVLKILTRWSLITALLVVTGCTAPGSIKTWEGPDRSAAETGVLIAPPDIKVVSIDGVEQREYLLDALTLRYQLLPGKRVVVFRYAGLYANTSASDEESKSVVIESPDQVAVIDVQPGETYEIVFERPETPNSARALAAAFSAEVVGSQGGRFAVEPWDGSRYQARAEAIAAGRVKAGDSPLLAGECEPGQPHESAVGNNDGSGLAPGMSRIDALKVVWGQASAAEKKAFLRWAFK